MPIRILPKLLVSQIAAGEVIERPASVVKELIDNSLDAAATQIDVAVDQGGRNLIRVADNGSGIPPDDLPLAITAHATSKLESAEQLSRIVTLGFRGEALSSVAAVSRMRVTSRPTTDGRPAEQGATITVEADTVSPVEPAACAPGTVIEIRDLFFSTPARRRFMRTAQTEYARVAEVVQRAAMVHPHVGFTLTHAQRRGIDLPPDQTPRDRCVALIGKELDEALLEYQSIVPGVVEGDPQDQRRRVDESVWGLAGTPAVARATSKFQYLFVNGRPIRDRNIAHAVREAYRGLIPHDKHPLAVVCLDLDPAQVDVNVHPTKAEVRFREPNRVHGMVLTAIRQRLLSADLTPSARLAGDTYGQPTPKPHHTHPQPHQPHPTTPTPHNPDGFVQYLRDLDPKHQGDKGFDLQDARRQLNNPFPPDHTDHPPQPTAPPTDPPSPVLQVHGCYLVTKDDHGLVIVDQHALHERVMFEELRRRVLGKTVESQRLLTPAVIPSDPTRLAALEQAQPLFKRIGIDIDPIGPDTLGVHGFPSLLFERNVDPAEFVEELLDQAAAGELPLPTTIPPDPSTAPPDPGGPDEAALNKVLSMMACKAAVKAGDSLAPQEIAALLAQREKIERSSACPHGRPTTVRLTQRDMERHFQRS